MPPFEIVSEITSRQVIARGQGIRDLQKLKNIYGEGNWIKCKGEANVRLPGG